MHFAKHAAANALTDGRKSVELCQAYVLMSVYAVPARKWEEDRSWLYTGLAIRIATDLNLHRVRTIKPQSERHGRELINQARTWMILFNLDRSTATQFGKTTSIKEDSITRSSRDWYKKSQYNNSYDIHLCAYTSLLRIVAHFHEEVFSDPDTPTGLKRDIDFRAVTLAHDGHLNDYHEEWARKFADESSTQDQGCVFRCSLLPYLVEYSRLVMFSFGLQQAYQRGFRPGDEIFFTKCLSSAKSVISSMVENLAPSKYMRYAPDGHFVFVTFASAFLLKLLRPNFAKFLAKEQEKEIFSLIGRLIQTFFSPDVSMDARHTPHLYGRFLANLLARYRRRGSGPSVGRIRIQNTLPDPNLAVQSYPTSSTHTTASKDPSSQLLDPYKGPRFNYAMGEQYSTAPAYQPEDVFGSSFGAFDFEAFGDGTFNVVGDITDDEMLASMQVVDNLVSAENMLMPGFTPWSESQSPLTSSSGDSPAPCYGFNAPSVALLLSPPI